MLWGGISSDAGELLVTPCFLLEGCFHSCIGDYMVQGSNLIHIVKESVQTIETTQWLEQTFKSVPQYTE